MALPFRQYLLVGIGTLEQLKKSSFTLFTLFFILVFLGLGTWQLQRKTEKEALLQALEHSQKKQPENVDSLQTPDLFQPLFAEGHFLPNKTIFLQSKTHQGKSGVYVLDVFETEKGQFLLVQRGWSPKEISSTPSGYLRIEGISRTPSLPNSFQPNNTPPTYFWINLTSLSQDLNLPLLPYYLVAKAPLDPQILPTDPIPLPRNHHLGYAITWYCLAFALLIMLLWSRRINLRTKR